MNPARQFECSIVIPLLAQNDRWLEQSIRSALDQTIRCEVIVVFSDDTPQSNLDTIHSLADANDNLLISRCSPTSFPKGLNIGFFAATSSRVGIVFSDDWLDPRAVELCLPYDADVVSTGHSFFAADGVTEYPEIRWIPDPIVFAQLPDLERKASYLKHFFLFRKSKLNEIGGADEAMGNFPGIDDYDMIWTLLEHHASVAFVPDSLYLIRDHEADRLTLKGREESVQGLVRILRKHRVEDAQMRELIAAHEQWYGEPVHRVYRRLRGLEK